MRWTTIIILSALIAAGPAYAQRANDPLAAFDGGTVTVTAPSAVPAHPNVYGTVALNAGVTPYGARWRRVSAADQADPRVRALAAAIIATSSDPLARLALVHAEVGRRISWRSDLDTYHVSDYWAQAGETLNRGVGDSEDIAIVKMQILKAAGFAARDIYLSIGRDHQRGADTLLLVRVGPNFYSLDDRRPRPLAAEQRQRFDPVITLGRNSAWLHGRRIATRSGGAKPYRAALSAPAARR